MERKRLGRNFGEDQRKTKRCRRHEPGYRKSGRDSSTHTHISYKQHRHPAHLEKSLMSFPVDNVFVWKLLLSSTIVPSISCWPIPEFTIKPPV